MHATDHISCGSRYKYFFKFFCGKQSSKYFRAEYFEKFASGILWHHVIYAMKPADFCLSEFHDLEATNTLICSMACLICALLSPG